MYVRSGITSSEITLIITFSLANIIISVCVCVHTYYEKIKRDTCPEKQSGPHGV